MLRGISFQKNGNRNFKEIIFFVSIIFSILFVFQCNEPLWHAINDEVEISQITVSTISDNTTEAGGNATFTVVLDTPPLFDVTIGLSSDDGGEGIVSPASVTFTSGNWNIPQTIIVTGVDDYIEDGDQVYNIITSPATSSDVIYNGMDSDNVPVINIDDNDTAGITVSTISGNTTESGGGSLAVFTIVLNSEPTGNVVLGISSSDITEGTVSPASITFTSGDWNVTQNIKVIGFDDVIVDGTQLYDIIIAAATSPDLVYNGIDPDDISMENKDDDSAVLPDLATCTWTENPVNPIVRGGSSDGVDRAYYPSILKVGSTYHMWYGDGKYTRHATSSYRGFHDITHPASLIIDDNGTTLDGYHPHVLYSASGWDVNGTHYGGTFLMYLPVLAWNPVNVYHSSDGSTWTLIGAVQGVNSYTANSTVYNLDVVYNGPGDWESYTDNGFGHIQYLTSTDGMNWIGQAEDILHHSYGTWDDVQSEISPFAVKTGGVYYLFYSSGATVNNQAIGLATSTDGQNCTKSGSNPIFSVNDGVAWRDVRSYVPRVIPDSDAWVMYFVGRTNTPSTSYSIGYATCQ